MRYPRENAIGTEPDVIRIGDLVWWNEGVCVGFIADLWEKEQGNKRWGMDGPGIALTNLHPFAPNEQGHKKHIGFTANGGTVMYPANTLADEGVELLSPHERAELAWAISTAKSNVSRELRHLPFCVSAVMNADRHEEDCSGRNCRGRSTRHSSFRRPTEGRWCSLHGGLTPCYSPRLTVMANRGNGECRD